MKIKIKQIRIINDSKNNSSNMENRNNTKSL